ncbi:hypothetical protein FBULB1_7935 [Fusarium bulbicola]|nr:hypothetical protein FBULB1_7935 [Fusarium bulbicola]
MSQIRNLFDRSSRDVFDESDENYSVKFEQFDARHIGRYPRLRILRPDAETEIFNRVTKAVCDTNMARFPIARQPRRIRDAVQRYISQPEPTAADIEAVKTNSLWNEMTSRNILLLRGFFVGGILSFALGSKRWRVNYGIDHNREKTTKLAVPFRAKNNPTPRSEFSQPGVVITLTCLSYYYGGLDDNALFTAFELLSRPNNATQENLEGVNLKDRVQYTTKIFPHLDLPEQKHTNALILEYLLQPEDRISSMPQEAKGTVFNSSLLLQIVSNMSSNTRVILVVVA